MEVESYAHGEPCWQDPSSPDVEKAVAFYSGLFGWECPEAPPELGGLQELPAAGQEHCGDQPADGPEQPNGLVHIREGRRC